MVCARQGTVKKRMNVERLLRSLWGTFSVVDHLESLGADGLGLFIELVDHYVEGLRHDGFSEPERMVSTVAALISTGFPPIYASLVFLSIGVRLGRDATRARRAPRLRGRP